MASLIRRIGLHKLSVPLRTNITTIFIFIFIAFSGFIVWFNYSQNSKTALHAADRLMNDISEKVVERAEAHLQPLFVMAELSTELPDVRFKPDGLSHPNDRYLMRALERHAQILSFYTGFEDGDFYQIQALATGDDGIRAKLDAPAGAFVRRVDAGSPHLNSVQVDFMNPMPAMKLVELIRPRYLPVGHAGAPRWSRQQQIPSLPLAGEIRRSRLARSEGQAGLLRLPRRCAGTDSLSRPFSEPSIRRGPDRPIVG